MPQKILIAEREETIEGTSALARSLTRRYSPGIEVEAASSRQDLLRRVGNSDYTAIYVGCCFDGDEGSGSGLDLVRAIRQTDRKTPVYLLGVPVCPIGQSEAVRAGATDYVSYLDRKKFRDILTTHVKQSSDR